MSKAVKRPTKAAIDKAIADYEKALKKVLRAAVLAKGRGAAADALKAGVIEMVQSFGAPHAKKSKLLEGLHNSATITTGTITVVVDAAVEKFKKRLEKLSIEGLVERFFSTHTIHQMVESPDAVLKSLDLPSKTRTSLETSLARCFKPEPKKPSLKVTVVIPEKPSGSAKS